MEERDKEEGCGVPDMTLMPQITEEAINDNLKIRYKQDLVYTYTGSILVAVNPYKELGCYSTEHMQNYRGRAFGALPPHVFALAESAYSSIRNGERNQSVVISGESGAGKTETTKFILQYLCAAGGRATWAEQQILEANTVLEAFGNAKTVRNDNSSRFGKFVEVRLDRRGGIKGAVLRDFLLERARITGPSARETNYHVFYQLVEGAKHNEELRKALCLRSGAQYKYLRPDDEEPRTQASERGQLEALQLALTVLQVPPHMCEGLFKVLAAILWLGNLEFQDVDGERTSLSPTDDEAVNAVAELLGLEDGTARRVLLERQINVRGNVTDIPLRLHEARENRHAMARALYSRTFAWLVRHVNSCSSPGRDAPKALGVLDIFGFENFAANSLEQLCINYANEKLHMFFNNYVFALEQEIYRQEGIMYNPIQFTDNASCLELLEKPPRSLLKLLSEQCHMPKGCDSAYLTNIQSEFGAHVSFVKGSRRKWEEEFGVAHYAGAVSYSVRGFVDKNRDTQQDVFIDHLTRSQNPFVRELADYVQDLTPPGQECSLSSPNNSTNTAQRGTSKGRPTVVDTFRAQLQSLVDMLQATDVLYVRCIKPNELKEAGKYSDCLVLEQLRYLGMNEIVKIRRDGYPVHLTTPQFKARYRCLLPHPRPPDPDVHTIMSTINASTNDWQIGHTKIFMRSSVHSALEAKRTLIIQNSALRIQKWYKGSIQRRQYTAARSACVILQAAWRGWRDRAHFLRCRRAATTLQRHLRGAFAREVATALREMKRVNEEIQLREERNSVAEKERAQLENMADQLRGITTTTRADSVNLDNLFDFLADVPQQRGAPDGQPDVRQPTIAEIGDTMERLVVDLDQELENVLATEKCNIPPLDELQIRDNQRKPDGAASDDIPPSPSLPQIPTSLPLARTIPISNGHITLPPPSLSNGIPALPSSNSTNGMPPPPSSSSTAEMPPPPSLTNGMKPLPLSSNSTVEMPPPPSSLMNGIPPMPPSNSTVEMPPPPSLTNGMSPPPSSTLTNGYESPDELPPPIPECMTSSTMSVSLESDPPLPPLPPACDLPPPPPLCSPPPPPSLPKDQSPPELTNGIIPNGKLSVVKGKEPIYESVLPRHAAQTHEQGQQTNNHESNGFITTQPEPSPKKADKPPPPQRRSTEEPRQVTFALDHPRRTTSPQRHSPNEHPRRTTSPQRQSPNGVETHNGVMTSRVMTTSSMVKEKNIPASLSMDGPAIHLNGEGPSDRTVRRKERVERRLQQLDAPPPSSPGPLDPLDLKEFVTLYFNQHPRSPEGTIMATLTRKNKIMDLLSKHEMITYYKGSSIPTSHIQMHDPDSVTAAVNIFRDLCRYMRGELTQEKETQVIQSIIAKGLEREELRDEILIQCMRQISSCPVEEWAGRVWLVLCLCGVSWQPSRALSRYYVSWLRGHGADGCPHLHAATWCLDSCRGAATRHHPPSTVEIAAMRRLGTIVCRFFFLDGRTKAIDVHPADTAAAAAARLADKLGLSVPARHGWAIYQQRAGAEEHVRATHYLYDVIAAWEMQQGPGGGSADNRFVFKRRLFRGGRELPHDPVEVALLYAQAVHSVVKLDEFPVSEKVALQLAGLQAQVSLGEPSSPPSRSYYSTPEHFLPARIAGSKHAQQWSTILAQAHRQYGAGRAELTAKALYLSCVMQYPLYGVTLFPVTYKGYWAHGPNVLLGVGSEGVVLVRPTDKVVLAEYPYTDIAALLMDPVDNGLTLSLTHHGQHDGLRCVVLECAQKNEAAWLMAAYSPALANGLAEEPPRRAAPAPERSRLSAALRTARRNLVDSGVARRPSDVSAGNFLRNTLRRLSKHKLERGRLETYMEREGESYKGFPSGYWMWSRSLPHSLTRLQEQEEGAAMQIFKDIMSHAGLSPHEGSTTSSTTSLATNTSASSQESDSDDRLTIAQSLLQRCLQKDSLLCELYVQLIKQTTEHPEPSSLVSGRHWSLLCAAVGTALPPSKHIRRLLLAHLRYRGTALHTGEEGKFARRAEQVALSIAQVPRRLSAPSKEELLCAAARRPLHIRVLLLDGKQHGLIFGPAATADQLVNMLKEKIGLTDTAIGYALYEVCASTTVAAGGERALAGNERVGDVLARWEKAGATAAACRLVFKKRLFLGDRPLETTCMAEMELLYYQVLHAVRNDRLPIETDEAVMLAALHAQVSSGDCSGGEEECVLGAAGVLPPRLSLPPAALRLHHLALRGTPPHAAMQRALTLASYSPLTKSTIFDVMQSFTSNWPRPLWLAIDARGLSLLRRGSRAALVSHDHDQLLAVSPAPRALLLVTRTETTKNNKLVLSTDQAYQIATLIKDYIEAVRGPVTPAVPPAARPLPAPHH